MIKYPYLPPGRNILYVSTADRFMAAARETARLLSSDRLQPTGAVVVRAGEILGRGANQVFLKHLKIQFWHRRGFCLRKFLRVKSGRRYWLCPACGSCRRHAEVRALADAQKHGQETAGADLYLWGHWWCCRPCWDKIIAAGIRDVYLLEGSQWLFNAESRKNILGKQFEEQNEK